MPRFYGIVRPSTNKAATPGKEKKAGKPPGAPLARGKARVRLLPQKATGTARIGPRAPSKGIMGRWGDLPPLC